MRARIHSRRLEPRPRSRSRHRHVGPGRCDRSHQHLEPCIFALQPLFERRRRALGAAAGGVHPIAMLAHARDDAVVDQNSVFVQQQSIARLADGERRQRSDVHEVEKPRRIGAKDFELAERRTVENAGMLADGPRLPIGRRLEGLAGPRVGGGRHQPPYSSKTAPRASCQGSRRQPLQWPVAPSHAPARETPRLTGANGGRNRVVPTGRCSAGFSSHQHQRVDVGGLSLIRAHARRRIALQVLDRAVIFARREADVVRGDIILKVDELLSSRARHVRIRKTHSRLRRAAPAARLRRASAAPTAAACSNAASGTNTPAHAPTLANPAGATSGTNIEDSSTQRNLPPA